MGSVAVKSAGCVIVVDDYSAVRVSVHGHDACGSKPDDCCGADVLKCGSVCRGELHPEDDLPWLRELLEDTVPIREPDVPFIFLVGAFVG